MPLFLHPCPPLHHSLKFITESPGMLSQSFLGESIALTLSLSLQVLSSLTSPAMDATNSTTTKPSRPVSSRTPASPPTSSCTKVKHLKNFLFSPKSHLSGYGEERSAGAEPPLAPQPGQRVWTGATLAGSLTGLSTTPSSTRGSRVVAASSCLVSGPMVPGTSRRTDLMLSALPLLFKVVL